MEKIEKQLAVIYILWLRQIKRYLHSRSRVVASLVQPILLLFALGMGLGPIYARAGSGDYIQFLAPGIIAMSILFTAMFSGVELISDKQFGFLKETLVAPISRYNIMIGRTLGGATVAVFQGFMVLAIASFFGFHPSSLLGVFLAAVFMFLIALLFTALGTSFASFMNDMHAFPIIMNFIIMPMFFLSGAIFPIEGLPHFFGMIVRLDPLTYGVDGIRGALSGVWHFSFLFDFSVLGIITLIILSVGAYLFKRIEA